MIMVKPLFQSSELFIDLMFLRVEVSRSMTLNNIPGIAILAKKIKKGLPMQNPYEDNVNIAKAQRPQGNRAILSGRTMTKKSRDLEGTKLYFLLYHELTV